MCGESVSSLPLSQGICGGILPWWVSKLYEVYVNDFTVVAQMLKSAGLLCSVAVDY